MDDVSFWHPAFQLELLKFETASVSLRWDLGFVLEELFIADREGYAAMAMPAHASRYQEATYFVQRRGAIVLCALFMDRRVRPLHIALLDDPSKTSVKAIKRAVDCAIATGESRAREYISELRRVM